MGLFDTILVSFKCPNCGAKGEKDMQTKDGIKSLGHYRLGDTFTLNYEHFKTEQEMLKYHSKRKFLISLLGGCKECDAFFNGTAWINTKTRVIEEVNIHSYSVKVDITLKDRRRRG